MAQFAEAVSQIDAPLLAEILLTSSGDADPIDLAPDDCWRCDARPATTDVGLCTPCRTDLG